MIVDKYKYLISAFCNAWEMLIDFNIPFEKKIKSYADEEFDNDMVLFFFPIVGLLIGLLIFFLLHIALLLLNIKAVSLIFSVLLAIFLEAMFSGRNISSLVSFCELRNAGHNNLEALVQIDDDFSTQKTSFGTLALVVLFLIKIISLGLLIYFNYIVWIPIMLVANFAVQGYLAKENDWTTGEPILEISKQTEQNNLYISILAVFVLGLFCNLFVALTIGLIVALLVKYTTIYLREKLGGVTPKIIGFIGYIVELIMLLLGISLLLKG